jgi:DNA polymerase-4
MEENFFKIDTEKKEEDSAERRFKRANTLTASPEALTMYIDMNSFFASCEQQDFPEYRDKPIGVCTYDSPMACVIAPSTEAKRYGVKTGMRLNDCRALCPQLIAVPTRPFRYRQIHVDIIEILGRYCDKENILAKSIDEAVLNFTSYRLVYKDLKEIARQIKQDIKEKCGEYIKCSIGIAPNSFLAKLGTELQKPDGLVEITPENIDEHLKKLSLTDLPGIARNNARRLQLSGINTPYDMRHSSSAALRKAFGGIVGHYWYCRLNFMEVDMYENKYRAMSAGRTVSRPQRESPEMLQSLFISLCTRLEQRLVKQGVFCREVSFSIRYKDFTSWDTHIRLPQPVQDAMELRSYIMERIRDFEQSRSLTTLFNDKTQHIVVVVSGFVSDRLIQYSLFESKIRQDTLRKVMYKIKDDFGRDKVRKAAETVHPDEMKDAIGFGSVKDLYTGKQGNVLNKYLLEK